MTAAPRRAGDTACVAIDRGLSHAERAGGPLALTIAPTDRELAVLADLVDRVVEAGGDR